MNKNVKKISIKENPYIRSAYIIFSEYYNFTKTAPYDENIRKMLEGLNWNFKFVLFISIVIT